MSNTMTFRLNGDGYLSLVNNKEDLYDDIIDIKKSFLTKLSEKSKNISYSVAPLPILAITGDIGGAGIFWDAFMKYIFPYMLDIAKVFCAIKIAQAFYQERRGGREGGSGIEAVVTYGKFYLLFALMPWAVELLDQLGSKMLMELNNQ